MLPFDLSYEVDAWGRIHLTVQAATASAQASAADLETARLSIHAELAADYFALRGLDAQKQLLDSTVVAYQKALDLTTNRYNGGLAAKVEVAQAETQLETTQAQAIDVGGCRSCEWGCGQGQYDWKRDHGLHQRCPGGPNHRLSLYERQPWHGVLSRRGHRRKRRMWVFEFHGDRQLNNPRQSS